jgi:hypothetical protein
MMTKAAIESTVVANHVDNVLKTFQGDAFQTYLNTEFLVSHDMTKYKF